MYLVVISWCQVLQFMWWTMLLITTQELLLILLQEEAVTRAEQGGQAHFSDAECRFPAAAEVACLQTPSSYSFTETLALEELQLLPQRRGGHRMLL